jgi:hypothetical protein
MPARSTNIDEARREYHRNYQRERRVRALSDAALARELKRAQIRLEILLAEVRQRQTGAGRRRVKS